jgi:peptidoglycan/xylan/chitin deacetylase (PgdA/CDA1 family)
MTEHSPTRPGALVISLDFEQHWGMRDHVARQSPSYTDLRATGAVVRRLASTFDERRIRATWATVGFLFARTGAELADHLPERRPSYLESAYDPYGEPVGSDEAHDPEHLAGSLIRLLADTVGQEVASHTFSHFYCLEAGQTEADLAADLAAAQTIAGLYGLVLTSLVLPRNQWNPRYATVVRESGFTCFRGPQPSPGHRARAHGDHRATDRMARLIDTYGGVSPPPTFAWEDIRRPDGLCDVPASAFLRPYSPGRRRLDPLPILLQVAGMRDAARRGRIFHLWWHPHNFAAHPTESFALLDQLLGEYDRLAEHEGMRSLSMGDVAAAVNEREASDAGG